MAKKSKVEAGAGVGNVDLAEVERILAFMQKHGLEEFEYDHGGVHIRLKKASGHSGAATGAPRPSRAVAEAPVAAAAAPVQAAPPAAHAAAGHTAAVTAETEDQDLHIVKSPIVGTFYSAPAPEAAPFVTVGARVEPGQVLCIIEAMKLMNEIESDVAGEVVRIFVDTGHPVEYGASLFGIRPAGKK